MEVDHHQIYENHSLEWEMSNFIKVWISVVVSLCYCYAAAKLIPKGLPRLLAFLPVVFLFLALPLNLHSMHLCGLSSFFIAWLANFKLLLLAFHTGPLSDPSLSLPQFVAIASFPIKIQQNPTHHDPNPEKQLQTSQNGHKNENPPPKTTKRGRKSLRNYAVKVLLMPVFVRIYDFSDHIHPKLIMVIFCFHMYFMLEIMLAVIAALAQATLGLELEPQFNDPYLSTSLQDFWGRRWNLMVPRTLRPTVYDPVLGFSTRIVGRKWAPLPAVFSTFVVSALMHELIFYYLGRKKPTWEITWFFLLHGACLVVEIAVKKALAGRCHFPRVISTPLSIGFVMVTAFWLFFPEFFRCKSDVRPFEEYALLGAFVKDLVGEAVMFRNFNETRA
ncbi:hypothetical protein U1Q18_008799 [Sarracenia purpurea var. burkii]